MGSQGVDSADAVQEGQGARILVLRGVAWRADAVEPLRLWQGLVRFWPAQLAGEGRGASILAHSGAEPPSFSCSVAIEIFFFLIYAGSGCWV